MSSASSARSFARFYQDAECERDDTGTMPEALIRNLLFDEEHGGMGGVKGISYLQSGSSLDKELVFHVLSITNIMVPVQCIPAQLFNEILDTYPFIRAEFERVDVYTSEILRVQNLQCAYNAVIKDLRREVEGAREELKTMQAAALDAHLNENSGVRSEIVQENASLGQEVLRLKQQIRHTSALDEANITLLSRICKRIAEQGALFHRMIGLASRIGEGSNPADRYTGKALGHLLRGEMDLLGSVHEDLVAICDNAAPIVSSVSGQEAGPEETDKQHA